MICSTFMAVLMLRSISKLIWLKERGSNSLKPFMPVAAKTGRYPSNKSYFQKISEGETMILNTQTFFFSNFFSNIYLCDIVLTKAIFRNISNRNVYQSINNNSP